MKFLLTLLVAWFLPLSAASADYRFAEADFMSQSMEERSLVQLDLTWLGHYRGFVDAQFGPLTFRAIQEFQQRGGWRPNGILSTSQREALSSTARSIAESVGFEMLDDPRAELTLGVPKRLAPDSVPTRRGTRWQSPNGDFVLDTILVPAREASFEELYRRLRSESRTRRVEYARLLVDRLVVSGRNNGMEFYTVMYRLPGEARGITVSWAPNLVPGIKSIVLALASSTFEIEGPDVASRPASRSAEDRFWVMIGSYESRNTAVAAARRYVDLIARSSVKINVSVYRTGSELYAVAIGPAPRAIAERLRDLLRDNQAPPDAWLSSGRGFVAEIWNAEAAGEPRLIQLPSPSEQEPDPNPSPSTGSGTGFFITADGMMLTNAHVVAECRKISVPDHGPARILRQDKRNDLAVLRVESAESIPHASFQANQTRVQSDVVVLGYPLAEILGATLNATSGQVSSLSGIQGDSRFIQITAPLQPGNSGGPVLDMAGRVVGVATARIDDGAIFGATGALPQNMNFAIRKEAVVAFLSAAGIDYRIDAAGDELRRSDIAEQGAAFTRPVICSR